MANYFDRFDKPKSRRGEKAGGMSEVRGVLANVYRRTGVLDEVQAGFDTAVDAVTGRLPPGDAVGLYSGQTRALSSLAKGFKRNLQKQRDYEDDFAERRPVAAAVAGGLGSAATLAVPGGAAAGGGNALMAGARGATVAAGTGYALGLADRGNAQERIGAANRNALIAAPLGFAAGAIPTAIMSRASSTEERAARGLADRTRVDPAAMRDRAAEITDNGFESPALVDVMDDSGRSLVGAAATRNTPAREAAREFAERRALDLPDRMSRQARRTMSADPRTPQEIAQALAAERTAAGNANFGAVRGERVPLTPDAVAALRSDDGREAVQAAARASLRSLDPAEREIGAELNRLAGEVLDRPGEVQVTVGMSQSISEALYDAADAAARAGRGRQAADLGRLARAIRDNAATSVPRYRQALDEFAASSRLIDAAGQGEDFLARNTDEFVAATPGPGQPGNDLARATARRAVERAAGENTSAAPGVARRLATAPEQRARNSALLGEDAAAMERGMATEERMVRNAAEVSPRTGSPTQPRQQAAAALAEGARGAMSVASGDPRAIAAAVINRVKSAGLNDREAEALVNLSIDPRRLNEAIALLERRGVARQEAANLVRQLHLARIAGTAVSAPSN